MRMNLYLYLYLFMYMYLYIHVYASAQWGGIMPLPSGVGSTRMNLILPVPLRHTISWSWESIHEDKMQVCVVITKGILKEKNGLGSKVGVERGLGDRY